MSRLLALIRRAARDRRGIGVVEFALGLPLLLGFTLGGIEMANYIIANNVVQRLATTSADMLSQAGLNDTPANEGNVYDIFYALDVSARPLDMRNRGRIILTAIQGSTASDGKTGINIFADKNNVTSQQFDGGFTAAVPLLGCHTSVSGPVYSRVLPPGEIMVHAQVSYLYQPVFLNAGTLSYFHVPPVITRTAVFRMRKNKFEINGDGIHAPKGKCDSATGT